MGFTNPVYDNNFADPHVIAAGEKYYAFATNGPLGNIQTLKSPDLVSWEQVGDALPSLPAWSSAGKVWAPEVAVHGADRYVMYYTTADDASGRQCVGVAVASDPKGPYVDKSSKPLICQDKEGGSIDASPFQDSTGQRWLYWKNDGNAIGVDTWIYASRLSADGLTLTGETTRLIKQTLPWEGNLVEAPYMVERDGKFHLFYSANAFDKAEYAVGHALCTTPAGPCAKSGDPILTTSDAAAGPGHNMVLLKDNRYWFVYHAWDPALVGVDPPGRTMWLSELTWSGDKPTVQPPLKDNPSRP
ncbi:glycoside hydrolase family 43 protein [Kribbella sancticallisti]|uniref:Glycoside hydrolase family 43 protein n=1 Tax=Kribbella sancticallisti TaxID=460087 RepID=A0ABN2CTD6_9ACTN